MERHTQGDRLRPVIRGTRRPVPEPSRPEPDAAWWGRRDHDYTYGLSKESLRPTGPFEEDIVPIRGWSGPPVQEPAPVQIDDPEEWTPPVEMPEDETPWWMDEGVITARNEDMLADLLEGSQ